MKKKKILLASGLLLLSTSLVGGITAGVLLSNKNQTLIPSTNLKSEDKIVERDIKKIENLQDDSKKTGKNNNKTKAELNENDKSELKKIIQSGDKDKYDLKVKEIEEKIKKLNLAKKITPTLKELEKKLFYYQINVDSFEFEHSENFKYKVISIENNEQEIMNLKIQISDDTNNKLEYLVKFDDFISKSKIAEEVKNLLASQEITIKNDQQLKDRLDTNGYTLEDFDFDSNLTQIEIEDNVLELNNYEIKIKEESFDENQLTKKRKLTFVLKVETENNLVYEQNVSNEWSYKSNDDYLNEIKNKNTLITEELHKIINEKKLLPYQIDAKNIAKLNLEKILDKTIKWSFSNISNVEDYNGTLELELNYNRGNKNKKYIYDIETKAFVEKLEDWGKKTKREKSWETSASSEWYSSWKFWKGENGIYKSKLVFTYQQDSYWNSKDEDESPWLEIKSKDENPKFVYDLLLWFYKDAEYFIENSYVIEYKSHNDAQWKEIEADKIELEEVESDKRFKQIKALIKDKVYAVKISFPSSKRNNLKNRHVYAVNFNVQKTKQQTEEQIES
ncbi:hypothetical protein [[Mycoplasma] collis]|uniref:hypothetical protein n=1 Tax=[Mycoplasma] collis TaxID=2127 RepID=UPI00051BA2CD|nr:hypothetical protein [[Mycoplasma] collis]